MLGWKQGCNWGYDTNGESINTFRHLLCWPTQTKQLNNYAKVLFCKYVTTIILHSCSVYVVLYIFCRAIYSVVYYWYSYYSIIVTLACVVRFFEICLRPSESSEKALKCCKWTDTVNFYSQSDVKMRPEGVGLNWTGHVDTATNICCYILFNPKWLIEEKRYIWLQIY